MFLNAMTPARSQGCIARGLPVKTLATIYDTFTPILQQDSIDRNKVLSAATVPTVQKAVSKAMYRAFPPLADFIEAQQQDPDIQPLFKYINSGHDKFYLPPTSPYARVARYMRIHKSAVFFVRNSGMVRCLPTLLSYRRSSVNTCCTHSTTIQRLDKLATIPLSSSYVNAATDLASPRTSRSTSLTVRLVVEPLISCGPTLASH